MLTYNLIQEAADRLKKRVRHTELILARALDDSD